ncbi:type II toxin-antitoxin system VapC family toxin [Thermococcus sp. P6]|uniref:type II toxin-antitoxin system VapC family toxin n=1 Tax=Thermococcus sp. P6 TaxID=122420 RepID=UPI000B59D4AB|nr:type II toxin-antitoxin system VapC family toxin [Thermococcus sp. P6]
MKAVLDSYAVLAYIADEEGADRVEEYLKLSKEGKIELYMNAVNLGEVYYIIARRKNVDTADIAIALLKKEPINIVPADERLSLIAGRIKAFHRLSYADAFAVATALDLNATLLTGDDEFRSVEGIIEVEWL